jgi:hypothetical protein
MTGRQKMRIGWTVLLLFNIAIFAWMEGYALSRADPESGLTLSRYVYEAARAWPLLVFILGQITGGLAVHFFWHWNPDEPGDRRG